MKKLYNAGIKSGQCISIPKGYSWGNFLNGDLHIDHILPVSKFNFKTPNDPDFKRYWSLKNLQLLSPVDNMKKSTKLEKPLQMSLSFG